MTVFSDQPRDDGTVRAAAYCRVSTEKEDQLNSLETQRRFFSAYIAERPGWISAGIFADEGLSGTCADRRPAFARMVDLAMGGEIDLIVTKEVSRFARNTVDALTVTRRLMARGVGVIFLNDGIDTRQEDGEFRLTILASVAQEESRKISQRTRWGQEQALRRGVVFGNNSIYGYTLRQGRLTVDPDRAEIVRDIFSRFLAQGKGTYVIARELTEAKIPPPLGGPGDPWSSTSVLRILKNEKYAGDLLQHKYRTEDYLSHRKVLSGGPHAFLLRNHHEAILPRETFQKAQAELARRQTLSQAGRRHTAERWYSGKMVCGLCGRSLTLKRTRRSGREYGRFLCRGRIAARRGDACSLRSVSLGLAETCARHVLALLPLDRNALTETALDQLFGTESAGNTLPGTDALRLALRRQTARRERLLEAYLDGGLSREDWTRLSGRCDRELVRLREMLDGSPPNRPPEDRREALRSHLTELLEEGELLLDETIERITVHPDCLVLSLRDLPVPFLLRAEARGSGKSHRIEILECRLLREADRPDP